MHLQHGIAAKLASAALVGLGGVGKAVAEHPSAAVQAPARLPGRSAGRARRTSAPSPPTGSRPAVRESSSTVRMRSPISVPPGSRVVSTSMPSARKHCRQLLQLGGLAATVEALEGDEAALPCCLLHRAMISAGYAGSAAGARLSISPASEAPASIGGPCKSLRMVRTTAPPKMTIAPNTAGVVLFFAASHKASAPRSPAPATEAPAPYGFQARPAISPTSPETI